MIFNIILTLFHLTYFFKLKTIYRHIVSLLIVILHKKINYTLHYLYLAYCHPEYREIVANEIVCKLNNDYEKVEPFFNNQDEFEQKLNVRFQFKKENTPSEFYYITIKSVFQDYQNESNSSQSKPTEPWLKNKDNEYFTYDKLEGTIEILYNSILIKDNEGQLVKIYPSDKFIVELSTIYTSKSYWEIID